MEREIENFSYICYRRPLLKLFRKKLWMKQVLNNCGLFGKYRSKYYDLGINTYIEQKILNYGPWQIFKHKDLLRFFRYAIFNGHVDSFMRKEFVHSFCSGLLGNIAPDELLYKETFRLILIVNIRNKDNIKIIADHLSILSRDGHVHAINLQQIFNNVVSGGKITDYDVLKNLVKNASYVIYDYLKESITSGIKRKFGF